MGNHLKLGNDMRLLKSVLVFVFALGIGPLARAGENLVVVELYTSQGCSSCPPADALLEKLAPRDDVLALALHVDYWDYIGWKDIFGSPAYSDRQRAYARAKGHRTIYTPQMIVGGNDHIVGNKAMELADAINAQSAQPKLADINLQQNGKKLTISAEWAGSKAAPRKMVFQLVGYVPAQDVEIRRGENAGRTIRYVNIVQHWQAVGNWDGKSKKRISVDLNSKGMLYAVILQADRNGPILAAAKLN